MTIQSEKDVLSFSNDGSPSGAGHLIELNAQGKIPIELFPTGTSSNQGPQGPTGPQGGTGPIGSGVGAQGPQGETGLTGGFETGPQGETGPIGLPGNNLTGPQGVTGEVGPQGETGPQGSQGGLQGETGPQGVTGSVGLSGITGPQGETGYFQTGPQGPQGDTGTSLIGPQGDAGSTGPQGSDGVTGADSVGSSDIDYVAVSGISGEGDFDTVRAAALAGHRNIQVIGDTTETGDIPVSGSTLSIRINKGSSLDMGTDNVFSYAGSAQVTIEGGSFTYALTAGGGTPIFNPDADSILNVRNVTVTNNSTDSSTGICGSGALRADGLRLVCPDYSSSGINFAFGINNNSYVKNTVIVGGGDFCDDALSNSGAISTFISFENISFEGEFSSSTNAFTITGDVIVNGVIFNHDVGTTIQGSISCPVSNVLNNPNRNCQITFGAFAEERTVLKNINLGEGAGTTQIGITGGGGSNLVLTNARVNDLRFFSTNGGISFTNVKVLDTTSGVGISSENGLYKNCDFLGTAEISGAFTATENIFINCNFEDIDVQSGADRNKFINCIFDTASVSGDDTSFVGCFFSTSLTINAGSNRTIVYGCRTTAAITDNGTGTITNANSP